MVKRLNVGATGKSVCLNQNVTHEPYSLQVLSIVADLLREVAGDRKTRLGC